MILEHDFIDNNFEDRMINKLDKDKKLTFDKIITSYKNTLAFKNRIKTDVKNYSNRFDRNMLIVKEKILTNITWAELGRKYYLTDTRIKQIYLQQLNRLSKYAVRYLTKKRER